MCDLQLIRFSRSRSWILALAAVLLVGASGCSDDDNPATPSGTAPYVTVAIASPAEGASFGVAETITFIGSALDSTLTPITGGALVWSSSLDNQIGTGTTCSATLSEGNHTITLTATDEWDRSGQASIHISVTAGSVDEGLLGIWLYSTSDCWSSGFPWPVPSETSGQVTLSADGDYVTMTVDSGFVCEPAFSCIFSGTIIGDSYVGSNSGVVDDEGGTVTNTTTFTATSATTAAGTCGSIYEHPDGSGSWGYNISLVRPD